MFHKRVLGVNTFSNVLEKIEEAIRRFERELREIEREIKRGGERLEADVAELLKYCNIAKKELSEKGLVKLYECVREGRKFYVVTYAGDLGAEKYITNKIEKAEEKYNEFLKRLQKL
jgi:prefoldin subunit 5